jgi:hypothetical protein
MRWLALTVMMSHATIARAEDKAVADALFEAGRQLAAEHKWSDACVKFEASYGASAAVGTLLHLADCHEHVGRTATAWVEFRDASDQLARTRDSRASYAKERSGKLEKRLVRLKIVAPSPAIEHLKVERDATNVTAAIDTAVPVDPGSHLVVASARGRIAWATVIATGAEGTTVTVLVPQLDRDGAPPTLPPAEIARASATFVGAWRCTGRLALPGGTRQITGTARFALDHGGFWFRESYASDSADGYSFDWFISFDA